MFEINLKLIGNSILAASMMITCGSPCLAQGGQTINDSDGNLFMEEVVDVEQQRREEAERKRIRSINRRTLSPEELKNVGIQMAPSGKLVPLINKNPYAPTVRRNTSQLTVETQPAWTMMPYNPGFYNPYMNRIPYGGPASLPYPNNLYPGYNPYVPRPNIGLGAGLAGMGSRTTVTYGDSPSPEITQEITMPAGGLGFGTFMNSFQSGNIPGGHRMSGSFYNPFTGSSSSFDSTVRPITPRLNSN